jgi:hypothetical protein
MVVERRQKKLKWHLFLDEIRNEENDCPRRGRGCCSLFLCYCFSFVGLCIWARTSQRPYKKASKNIPGSNGSDDGEPEMDSAV